MKPNRRLVMKSTLALGFCLASPAIIRATPKRKLRLGHPTGSDTAIGRGASAFAEAVARLTENELSVELYPNNVLGSENDMTKAVAQGSLDMVHVGVASLDKLGGEVLLADAPYLFRDVHHARSCFDGALGKHCASIVKANNLIALAFAENGVRHMTANKPILTPADLRGLKLRTPTSPVVEESFKALGASAASYPWAQLPEALASGRFDAQENPIINILSGKLYQWQSHLSLTGHIYAATILTISADVWDELGSDQRTALSQAALEGVRASRATSDTVDRDGVAELQKHGMTVIKDIDRAPFLAQQHLVTERLAGMFGTEQMKRIQALVA